MGLRYDNLDELARNHMVAEIGYDLNSGGLYLGKHLNEQGILQWPSLIQTACKSGSDDSLAEFLRNGLLVSQYSRRTPSGGTTMAKVPHTAAQTLAEGQFNLYYMRALSLLAIAVGSALVVYRARESANPRESSEQMIGSLLDGQLVLDELRRTKGVDPDTRIPLPNSGLTVRLS